MSEQESVWYYTQHGERKGPVTLEVLRGAIEHMRIDREKDLIWGPGLSDWVTMDKVPELQGMAAGPPPVTPPPRSPAPTSATDGAQGQSPSVAAGGGGSAPKSAGESALTNPYESPASLEDDNALADAMAARREGGGYAGMARLPYFLWSLFINIAGVVVVFALAGKYRALAVESGERNDVLALGVLATLLLLAILGLVISFSRLKNLSMSRWNILLCIVPIANIWLGFRMIACPPGYAQHKQLDLAGKVMLALFILYILLCVTVPVLFSAAGYYRAAAEQSEEMIEQQREQENAVEPME